MRIESGSLIAVLAAATALNTFAADSSLDVRSLTHGPKHHFFGYIGHVRTTPWNQSGRYIVALQTDFQDRMPKPDDAAEVVLIDTQRDNAIAVVDRSRGWNPQQGTMLYWNPRQPESQLFFNDRDPTTQDVFCVLYDTDSQQVVGQLGTPEIFPKPGGDVALSQDGAWFVNGHGKKGKNYYTILRRADGAWARSPGFEQGGYISGDLRLDPGPLWNRDGTQLLVPGIANDADRS